MIRDPPGRAAGGPLPGEVNPLSSFIFPGYPAYLELAAAELGLPGLASPAGRIVPLTALSNLCAQASLVSEPEASVILDKAAEFRDQLAVALRAAELMLVDVGANRSRPAVEAAGPLAAHRKARKGAMTPREPS